MAVGKCSWWLEGRRWGIPSGPGLPVTDSAPLHVPRPYFCLPLRHHKPCVCVWSRWENHLWRLQSSNCVRRVAERLVRARRVLTGRGQDRGGIPDTLTCEGGADG